MENLVIDSGVKEYNLNDKYVIRFNPTDISFAERLVSAFTDLETKQSYYKQKWEKTADNKEVFALASEMNEQMRVLIDDTLGDGLCDALFGDMNVYAMSGGLPVWANLFLAIMDEVDTAYTREQKLTNPKIKKYTAKYNK